MIFIGGRICQSIGNRSNNRAMNFRCWIFIIFLTFISIGQAVGDERPHDITLWFDAPVSYQEMLYGAVQSFSYHNTSYAYFSKDGTAYYGSISPINRPSEGFILPNNVDHAEHSFNNQEALVNGAAATFIGTIYSLKLHTSAQRISIELSSGQGSSKSMSFEISSNSCIVSSCQIRIYTIDRTEVPVRMGECTCRIYPGRKFVQ